ncbi:MAG: hypothetical protein ACP5JP_01095 [bacterium]
MKTKLIYLIIILSVFVVSSKAMAKDLRERLGLGFNTQIGQIGLPHLDALSVRYWINQDIGIQGDFAFMDFSPRHASNEASFGFGGKFLYNVIKETNMNLYAGGGVYVFTQPIPDTEAGFSLSALSGIEFFFQGLPNLGFNLELDLGVRYLNDFGTAFGISADSINAGFHYYF